MAATEETNEVIPFRRFDREVTQTHPIFYISGEILEPVHYIDMIHAINVATGVVYIRLNSPGGDLATGVQLMNAIKQSEAKVVTEVMGECYSLAAMLLLCGDEIVINDNCLIMFHNYSGGTQGKGNEQIQSVEATNEWFTELCNDLLYPVLSRSEIKRMLKGEDIWMGSNEIRKRLEK